MGNAKKKKRHSIMKQELSLDNMINSPVGWGVLNILSKD